MTEEWQREGGISSLERKRLRVLMRKYAEAWQGYGCPVEIQSGAIVPMVGYSGFYFQIDANTSAGLRKFHAQEIFGGDPQSELRVFQSSGPISWISAHTTTVYLTSSWIREGNPASEPVEVSEEPGITAAGVLTNLANPALSPAEIRKSIFEAEEVSFDASQVNTLKPILRRYIEEHRDNTDPTDLVAVASAIRRYVGIISRGEISSLAFILEAGHKAPVPLEVELEVTKMVVRKLSAVLPPEANSLPELVRQLMELARTYLNARLLPRQHHGAIALNSVLALTLLRVPDLAELSNILRRLPLPWFKQLVIRRAEALQQEFLQRFPGGEASPQWESLDNLIHAVRQGL